VKQPKKFPLRIAWYGLIILASLLPAIALSPWLGQQAHQLLLERAILTEELFHNELETRLALETERLVSILVNKSDPMYLYFAGEQSISFIKDLTEKISKREPMFSSIAIYNHRAQLITGIEQGHHTFAELRTDMAEFAVPMHGRTFISPPSVLNDGHSEFIICTPIFFDEKPVALLVGTVNIGAFWSSIRAKLPEHDSMIYLIDSRGSLLSSLSETRHQHGDLLSDKEIVRSLLAGAGWKRPELYLGFEEGEVFGIGSLIPVLKWGIISEIPSSAIMGPIIDALAVLTLIVFMLHILFGLLSLLFTKHLLTPITDLAKSVKRATTGDYTRHALSSPYIEIDALTSSFNTMINEIDHRENSLEQLSQAVEHAAEAIVIANRKGLIEYANPAFSRITGYPLEEVIGKSPVSFSGDKENQQLYKKLLLSVYRGELWEGTLIGRKKSGVCYPSLISIAPIYSGAEITHFVSIQQDMSDQVLLEEQLRQSQKMEAVGTLVGGIAHDFNNMLAAVTGNLYLARSKCESIKSAVVNIQKAEDLCYSSADMIAHLLAFARKGVVQMEHLSISSLLEKTIGLTSASIPESIHLSSNIANEKLVIVGDKTQLQQIMINLVNNACDAVAESENPHIHISLDRFKADDAFRNAHPEMAFDLFARISIHDNGHGIPEQILENIFEPFFSTKEEGKGSGLGLSMVYGGVQTHGGVIDVESGEKNGSTFHLYFPLADAVEVEDTVENKSGQELLGNGEIILLVDDELTVYEAGAEVLEELGYRVLVANNGKDGLQLFEKHHSIIQLVITDVVMPEVNGIDMAKAIRKIIPEMPFIFLTGYDKELFTSNEILKNNVLLTKPLSIPEMSQNIQQLLLKK